ncbi:MAG: efflux RND transporter periplasmic adaptor subunit [Kiritimatiellaeota bacterium]|nr:efflux RND transporter periplasmic adaptor subunit [Kiritimatiellota bacterium]
MKTKIKLTLTFTVVVAALIVAAGVLFLKPSVPDHRSAREAKSEQLYTCGMHPQVIQNKPGNCPICGMKLTRIRKQVGVGAGSTEREVKYYKSTMLPCEVRQTPGKDSMGMDMLPVYADEAATAESSTITIDPVTIQNMGIRTAEVIRGPLRRTIRSVATIDYNEPSLADVTTKFKGWIEKLYVDATGQQVHRGEPLFEIYSPELYSAQAEYLTALASPVNAVLKKDVLRTSAFTKLKYFDISDEQIAELEKTLQPRKTLRILSPIDGFVVEKNVVEGQMVDPGMKIYRLADLALVWVYAQIYEQDIVYLKLGQEAAMALSYLPGRQFRGRVTYIYPNVDEKTRTARVRMEFHNPGFFLKPGMFASVTVTSELEPSVLLVPDSAILRSGEKNTVFVALAGGRFDPRTVTLGPQAENDYYQVLSGLNEGEKIVTSGQFMLDSESQLREAIQKMIKPGQPAATAPAAVRETAPAQTAMAMPAKPEKLVYLCPMPEHVSIEYDHPGQCPICGMTLVPISPATLSKLPPGGKLLYYACPMPEHSDVHLDKPGKCPACGMTLIPVMEAPKPTPAEWRQQHPAIAPGPVAP